MAADFITSFHNLDGVLLKEKKKSFFWVLGCYQSLRYEERILQEINEKLVPKTYLEEMYKLEFLLYFRRSTEILELLKNGNDIAASKIIRQPWFIKSLIDNYTTGRFVQEIFPELSVVVRSKILKQFLKQVEDVEWLDDLFDCLLNSYGLKTAIILLSGCSNEKIRAIIKNGVKLSKAQLKSIHDYSSSLTRFYYEEYHRKGGDMEDLRDFSKYLSRKDPNLYVELLLKYNLQSYRLGRQTTKRYIYDNREIILEEPQKYLDLNIFHENVLVRQLGQDFPKFLETAMPKKLTNLMNSHAFRLLNHYPKKKRYDLYKQLFWNVYKKSLFLNKKFMTNSLLDFVQTDEEREKWVEQFENKVEFIKYKRSSKAVAELKQILFLCDNVESRTKLFEDIVHSCSISNDYDALLDTLKLLCSRFRNADESVFYSFFEQLKNKINLDGLTDEHWKCIYEIILTQSKRNLSINSAIVYEYSKYLYKSGKNFDEMIPIYLKSNNFTLKTVQFKTDKFRDEMFQREFLKLVLKHYSTKIEDTRVATEIVLAVRDWNKRHPSDVILVSEKQEIVEAIKKSVDVDWLHYKCDEQLCMNYLVCRENKYEEFTDIYVNHIEFLENMSMTKWYLKYRPHIFQEKLDKIEEWFDLKTRHSLLKFLKKYEHTGLVQVIVNYYLKKLEDPEEEKKDRITQLLAATMPKHQYFELLAQNIPEKDKLDLTCASIEETNLHLIQLSLSKSVRFSTSKIECLPLLLKYCRGDYFQSALFSLYSCFHRVPEKLSEEPLNVLLQKAVSVRKHSIFLATQVFPIEKLQDLLQKIYDTDKNVSIRKHLFTSAFKYFLKNPRDEFWNILQIHINNLSINEKESLILLTNVQDINDSYKKVFFQKVCEIFNNIECRQMFCLKTYYDKLMSNATDDDIKYFSEEDCVDIIKNKLFEEVKKNGTCVEFTIKFLMYGINTRKNIQNVLKVFHIYKQHYWQASLGVVARSVVYSIFYDIFKKTMKTTELRNPIPQEFPSILSEEWKKLFSMHETLEEYLMLDFMILKYKNQDDMAFYAVEIITIFNELRQVYGESIIGLFKNFLSMSLKLLLGDSNHDVHLIKLLAEILQTDCSLANCLLVVQLLPYYQHDSDFVKNYNQVVQKLKAADPVVQVLLNSYFKMGDYY